MTLGNRIKLLRDNRGIGQQELCDFLKIEQSTLANYENDRRTPKPEMISKIADYFGTTTDYLLGRTSNKNIEPKDKISIALNEDEELLEFWNDLKDREELKLLFKQTRELDKTTIQQVMRIIKAIEDEESQQ